MDGVKFTCISCGHILTAPATLVGKKGRCPKCSAVLVIPPPDASAQSAPNAVALGERPPSKNRSPYEVSNDGPSPGDRAGGRQYRYDAFISYRHVEPDRKWAKWLHTALETYRVPKSVVRDRKIAPRIKRVFRDEEELPASANLSKEIEEALQQSKFLIVICSPRTPESEWVNKEAQRFREMGRGDRILAFLIEGEPGESFPRALREIRRNVVEKGGLTREEIEEVEPLAADVRPIRKEGKRYLKRMARLRMLACLLGCPFDLLRRRERERQRRTAVFLGAVAACTLAVVGALGLSVQSARREAARQRALVAEKAEAERLANEEAERQRKLATDSAEAERVAREEADRQRQLVAEKAQAELLATQRAQKEAAAAAMASYFEYISAAYSAYFATDAARAKQALAQCRQDLRGWEWHWLQRNCDQSILTISGQSGPVSEVAVSPDGRLVAFTTASTMKVIDVRQNRELFSRDLAQNGIYVALAFSPDGQLLAVAGGSMTMQVFNATAGATVLSKPIKSQFAQAVSFSDDSKVVRVETNAGEQQELLSDASGGTRGMPPDRRTLDRRTLGVTYSAPLTRRLWTAEDPATEMIRMWQAQSPSRGLSVTTYNPGSFIVMNNKDSSATLTVPAHKGSVNWLVFTSDCSRIVSCGTDRAVRVWDSSTGENVQSLCGHEANVTCVAVSADTGLIVSGDDAGNVKVWAPAAAEYSKRVYEAPKDDRYIGVDQWPECDGVRFSLDGKHLLAFYRRAGEKEWQMVWDARTGALLWTSDETSPRPGVFDTITVDGTTPSEVSKIYDKSGRPVGTMPGRVLAVSADLAAALVLKGTDQSLSARVCAVSTGETVADLPAPPTDVSGGDFSADASRVFLYSGPGGAMTVYDASSGAQVTSYSLPQGKIIRFSRYCRDFFYIRDWQRDEQGVTSKYTVIEAPTGRTIAELAHLPYFLPDGKTILCCRKLADDSYEVYASDIAGGRRLYTLTDFGRLLWGLICNSSGTHFVTWAQIDYYGNTGTARVWDASTGRCTATLEITASTYAFSPDGTRLAVGGADGTLKVFGLEKAAPFLSLPGHKAPVQGVAFSPDGMTIASAAPDGVILWEAAAREESAMPAGQGQARSGRK